MLGLLKKILKSLNHSSIRQRHHPSWSEVAAVEGNASGRRGDSFRRFRNATVGFGKKKKRTPPPPPQSHQKGACLVGFMKLKTFKQQPFGGFWITCTYFADKNKPSTARDHIPKDNKARSTCHPLLFHSSGKCESP